MVLTFALTLPISRAAISLFAILFPLIWILEGNFKHKFQTIKNSKVLLSFMAFIGFTFLSILWSSDSKDALSSARLLTYMFTIFVLSTSLKEEWGEKIINFFLYGMFISEIFAYLIFFDIYAIKGQTPDYPSPFMMHIDYSIYLAFVSILLLHRMFSPHFSSKEKVIMFIFFLTVTINLFISIGRTGQVAFLVALFLSILLHFRFSFKAFLIFSLLTTGIFFGAYKNIDMFEQRVNAAVSDITLLQTQDDYHTSLGLRAAYWILSYDMFLNDPVLGKGTGSDRQAVKELLKAKEYGFSQATKQELGDSHLHNQYLMVIVQLGLFGLVIFSILFFYLFRLKISDRQMKETSLLFFTIFIIGFLAEPLWVKQFTLALFVLFSSIFINASLNNEEKLSD